MVKIFLRFNVNWKIILTCKLKSYLGQKLLKCDDLHSDEKNCETDELIEMKYNLSIISYIILYSIQFYPQKEILY